MNHRIPMSATANWAWALLAVLLLWGGLATPAAAQQNLQALIDRLDRYERDLRALQRQVYGGEVPVAPVGVGAGDTGVPGGADQRIAEYETALRALTDRVERAAHQMQMMEQDMTALSAELRGRLEQLEAAPPPAANLVAAPADGADIAAAEPGPVATPPQAPGATDQGDGSSGNIDTTGSLGTIAADGAPGAGTDVAAAVPPPAGGDPQDGYDAAYRLLRQADYDGAQAAFEAFLERNPDHALVQNAHYWLGETHYVRDQFERAAVAFARGYRAAPEGSKAIDNLLKLGMTFVAMEKLPEACATFDKLRADHPDAPDVVQERLTYQRERANCS